MEVLKTEACNSLFLIYVNVPLIFAMPNAVEHGKFMSPAMH
jgi:hypothetical protein